MPRPKGSKNKSSMNVEENIARITEEIESLKASLSEKKAELKKLEDMKQEEVKKKLMDAVTASGHSIDDIIDMISSMDR